MNDKVAEKMLQAIKQIENAKRRVFEKAKIELETAELFRVDLEHVAYIEEKEK